MSNTSLLAELADASAKRKKQAVVVDAELRVLRRERMMEVNNNLAILAARAYNAGIKMVDIKAQLGTSDHATVRRFIDTGQQLLMALSPVAMAEPEQVEDAQEWFTVFPEASIIEIAGVQFEVITWSDEGADRVMLSTDSPLYPLGYDEAPDHVVKEYDGMEFPTGVATSDHREIEAALRKGGLLR